MKTASVRLRLIAVLPALLLAGCGEGYELVKYTGFPYGNERTAGSGVAYVRANMMPEKGTSVQPELKETSKILDKVGTPPPPAEEAEPVQPKAETEHLLNSAEKIFEQKMKK